jgi:hypothetical protein
MKVKHEGQNVRYKRMHNDALQKAQRVHSYYFVITQRNAGTGGGTSAWDAYYVGKIPNCSRWYKGVWSSPSVSAKIIIYWTDSRTVQ